MSKSPKDGRDIAVRVILTAVLVVIALCMANIYSTLKKMRQYLTQPAPSQNCIFSEQMDMPVFPSVSLSGAVEVNGMPVRWEPDAQYDLFVASLISNGWEKVEADWRKVRAVSMSDSVMLTKTGICCFVMAVPQQAKGVLYSEIAQPTNAVAFQQNPWTADCDAPGRDIPAVPRPSSSLRAFSMIFENGSGAVSYRLPQVSFSDASGAYVTLMKTSGWKQAFGGADARFAWYLRGNEQCGVWLSRIPDQEQVFATVLYYGTGPERKMKNEL